MTPAELQQLPITRAPDVPGITAARRDDENPHGPAVTIEGGGVPGRPSGASPTGTAPGSAPSGQTRCQCRN